ncbi:uncharacterized protein LOC123258608 [Cotesia glomerata]|uniref:Uncharacterized protein n=1 Tax=Cotesia glomerata TaxID=32391 RepID=A0AAV7HZA5_COTGL|nr:uncharacterized protein LOC123258608 [Cotesia glomerata]XP_044574679.1 uncharacterized protein LOC123258608 [Cotesia glomerata]KAH0540557.1 hypothetical protein KQX54_018259 [Cotesia glomerata]
MCDSIENSVGEVEVMTDPETFWIFTSEIKTSLMQQFGSRFPILEEMLIKLEAEPDVDILRRIAANALSGELVNSTNSAIDLLFKSIGQPPEIIKELRQKFNRLIEGRLFIDVINDMALKIEREAEMLSSMLGINLAAECIFN